ncbi:MAG: tyrosine recombinase XerC [Clostridiales bacterium]|nr:tyrosine recombinase XerC [Clostridiales bacterium]
MDYRSAPKILVDFLSYHESVQGHSSGTVDEYFLDLRSFLRYMKQRRNPELADLDPESVDITDVDLAFVRSISLSEVYDYLAYLSREKNLNNASRARKVSSIRSFFKYLSNKTHQLDNNPVQDLDSPRQKKALPRYLTLDESIQLLEAVDGKNQERDYCILMLFLNCGLRISELVGLNVMDVRENTIRVLGKGNKERILFLNDGCKRAISDYLAVRNGMTLIDKQAFFVTSRRTRMTTAAVHKMVKKRLLEAGLDPTLYSAHKLRHTAATLMLQNGVDVRTLQEVLGHDNLNTTQIYTHVDSDSLRIAAKANPLSQEKRKKPSPSDSDNSSD